MFPIRVHEFCLLQSDVHYGINQLPDKSLEGYKEYRVEDDCEFLRGAPNGSLILEDGQFAICFPQDAHMGGLCVDKAESLEKLVFKVRV